MIDFLIDTMKESDWEQVCSIYFEGIVTGDATFETEAPSWEKWNAAHLPSCRLVARSGDTVGGWAALSPVSSRCVYGGVAEVSIYIGQRYRGMGLGRALLMALITESEKNGLWTLQAGIFPENRASIDLHKRCGFREVGRRERIGKMDGRWRDTVLLERRSSIVGID
jgi:L-amino acid N-acyltransferase YncA